MADMREKVRERTELALTFAKDGAYRSCARILKELAHDCEAHAAHVDEQLERHLRSGSDEIDKL